MFLRWPRASGGFHTHGRARGFASVLFWGFLFFPIDSLHHDPGSFIPFKKQAAAPLSDSPP